MGTFFFLAFLTSVVVLAVALAKGAADAVNPKRIRYRQWKAERQLQEAQHDLEETLRRKAEAEARYAEVRQATRQSRLELVAHLKRKYRICRWLFADEAG